MKRGKPSPFFIAACALVAAGVVLAFLAIGTPAHNRDMELDKQRTVGLDDMAAAIRTRYRGSGHLPERLSADFGPHADPGNAFVDPQTGKPYDYQRIDDDRFRLCAIFSAPSDTDVAAHPGVYSADWSHPAGVFCKDYSKTFAYRLHQRNATS